MKKILILAASVALLASCTKQPASHKIRFEITGKSSYSYQIGSVNKSGSVSSSFTVNEIAHEGDMVKCRSIADTSNHFGVELDYFRDDRSMDNHKGADVTAQEQL